MNSDGCLTISLDFELHWGVRDKRSVDAYGDALAGARQAIPAILDLFHKYQIHATWAVVGFLFANTKADIQSCLPGELPGYERSRLSPYDYLKNSVGSSEQDDPLHYAASIIRNIADTPHQEICTHTFSHYYCLEEGQTLSQFKQDLESAIKIANRIGRPASIVFPRNQYTTEHLMLIQDMGISCFRGNPSSFLYRTRSEREKTRFVRALRLLDSFVNIDGNHGYQLVQTNKALSNVPASRFLRPHIAGSSLLNHLRLKRIKKEMTSAARKGCMYHLWWHPHNFGRDTENNLQDLESILQHYAELNARYDFSSLNMGEISREGKGVLASK